MSTFRNLLLTLTGIAIIVGCEPKAIPVPIEGLKVEKDELRKFEIKVPANWYVQTRKGDIIVAFSSKAHVNRFTQFSKGRGGAKVEIRAIAMDSTTNIDSLVKRSKVEFEDGLDRYTKSVSTLGGKPGQKLYVEFDQEDGKFVSESYFAEDDSVITMVTFAAFGNTYQDYAEEFKQILASVKLAKKLVPLAPGVAQGAGGTVPPSDTLRPFNAGMYAISYPSNFSTKKGSAGALSSTVFVGARLDCSIQVDVINAKDQNDLDVIVKQNESRYPGSTQSASTLGGQRAVMFSYNPTAAVAARAYFAVKGDKMYRVTVNWNRAEQNMYLPVFDKCIRSIRIN
ncbi:MAG: hypothetical protein FJ211_00585 [Ignavibacteria bacterium]|nr:hypothetical protein [Ignavibacteria bacterium]